MKTLLIVILILSITTAVFLLKHNHDLKFKLEQQKQEIEASAKYIELLTEKILKNSSQAYDSQIQSERLADLLAEYLSKDDLPRLEQKNIENLERKNTLIPDRLPIIGDFVISQRFKEKHQAIDLASPLGNQVVAAATGEIIEIREDKYFGNMLLIDHFNGFVTVYAHLAKVLIEKGDIVKKGMVIGLVGDTGNSSGPHLHFEIIKNGVAVDPEDYIFF
jgi:murein DD-endopeptidase MepM/ murein hydrolase activator NlpD